ncbi:MAG: hypothetical protein J5855_05775, partial [Mailhella sp.]|nr:hypothetical protein [Mailhella sp.]
MDQEVLIPADAVLELQQNGTDIIGAMGWDQAEVEKMAEAGQDIRWSAAGLQAHLDADTMKQIIPVMRQSEEAMTSREAERIDELLQVDLDEVFNDIDEAVFEEAAVRGEMDRLRREIRESAEASPNLMRQIASSPDPETTLTRYVETNLNAMFYRFRAMAQRTGESLADLLGKVSVMGNRENGLTDLENLEIEEEDRLRWLWDRIWGVVSLEGARSAIDPETVRAVRGAGLGGIFSRGKGNSERIEELVAELRETGYVPDDIDTPDAFLNWLLGKKAPTKEQLKRWAKERREAQRGRDDAVRRSQLETARRQRIEEARRQVEEEARRQAEEQTEESGGGEGEEAEIRLIGFDDVTDNGRQGTGQEGGGYIDWIETFREAHRLMAEEGMSEDEAMRSLLGDGWQDLLNAEEDALTTLEEEERRAAEYEGEVDDPFAWSLPEDAEELFQFIGEEGAAALDRAEEATTRLDNLGVARQMEASGKDAKAVKFATGWE